MNTKVIDDVFFLCRLHLYNKDDDIDFNLNSDLEDLERIIIFNGLSTFLFKEIKKYDAKHHVYYGDRFNALTQSVQIMLIHELNKYRAIRSLVNEAKKRSLELVFFKGLILADLYPQYAERISSDSDILVKESDKDAVEKLLRDCGYKKNVHKSKKHVQVYKNNDLSHIVELHTRLWEDYEGHKISILKTLNLSADNTNIDVKACGIEVRTLGIEQHLIYQFFHIIKHFSLNGIGIRYLIDITLFVNKYFPLIDFKQFWNHIDMLGYTKFVEAFFRICIEELNMTDKVFEGHEISFIGELCDLKTDLLNIGYIYDKEAGWQIMGAMEAYFTGDAITPKSRLKRKLSIIFPPLDALPRVYSYAIKHPILLPIAWIHRGGGFLIKKQFHKHDFYGVREKINVVERRMLLMDQLGLTIESE